MASEGSIQRAIWLAVGKVSRLFRLNEGRAWISNLGPKGVQKLDDGSVRILSPRSIALGFADVKGNPVVGACDLPGWTSFTMTPELAQALMGRKIAIFTSIECKSTTGRPTPDQKNWCTQVQAAGGIAGIARSPEEALAIISSWHCQQALF